MEGRYRGLPLRGGGLSVLKYLCISNLAVIENIEIRFSEGLTVLTGETGAGKSILIDALGLILGDRADTSIIRTGHDRAEVSAEFELPADEPLLRLLDEQSINVENDEVLIRRVINKDGRSRAYINATSAPIQLLRDAGRLLIDIHGQHEHQSLLKRDEQRELLDSFGNYGGVLDQVSDAFEKWDKTAGELRSLTETGGEFGAQLALLKYQVEELQGLELDENELDILEGDYKRLSNVNSLLETTQKALDDLYDGEQTVNGRINMIKRTIVEIERVDPTLAGIKELLENAEIQISEAGNELRAYLNNLEQDPARLHQVEQRLDALHDAARKHRVQPRQLFAHFQSITQKLELMERNQARVAALEKERAEALKEYKSVAEKLDECRRKCAGEMAKRITVELRALGMPESKFNIAVNSSPDLKPHRKGNNQVEFFVSANPGQALQPLRKVASGGELSRISLAIQVIANQYRSVPTMIFDEVDAGIGGGIAEIVGNLLRGLAKDRQIFCVTHLPQVASQGDNHFQVLKTSDKKTAQTRVFELDEKERIEEIARMLGGVKISEQSRSHAKEMLQGA